MENANEILNFISELVNSKPVLNESFEKYKNLLNEKYMTFAKENDSFADEAGALVKLQNIAGQLEFLTYDEALLNKTVVAVAGIFSSGKSSFLNSFFQKGTESELPIAMDPTTAISAYVLNDRNENVVGYSYKGGKVNIVNNIFKLLDHQHLSGDLKLITPLIHHIVVRNKFVTDFRNLCFIDTPGFNPGKESYTDYQTAISAISNASALLWCFVANSGGITNDEIRILSEIYSKNKDIKIYVVATKADGKPEDELMKILNKSEDLLCKRRIKIEGISSYSSKFGFNEQKKRHSFHKGMTLEQFLKSIDEENTQKEEQFLKVVDEVFNDYIKADNERIDKLEKQIRTLNILERSVQTVLNNKEEIIGWLKSRIDHKIFDARKFSEMQNALNDEEVFDGINEIKPELEETIRKDKDDIKNAVKLCRDMKRAIAAVFGHQLNEKEPESKMERAVDQKFKFCTNCGKEIKPGKKFCWNCGEEVRW
ncbi:dynamin family protein [bacterium]|nr:dynamin family protein [bacterium]